MKNTLELLDEKDLLKVKAQELISGAEKETRKLNDLENTQFDEITKQLATIDAEIRKIEEDNKRNLNKVTTTKQTNQTMENFSLLKAINDLANNKQLDERAQEVNVEGQAEFRKSGQNYSGQLILPMETRATISATVAGSGQEIVTEDKLGILEPLRSNLVMVQAGATYMTGLSGTVSIPAYSGSNVLWAGETAGATDGAGSFTEVTLEPKRITALLDVSKLFLNQDSLSAEAMLKNDIVKAISNKLEATILGSASGSATQPAGLLNGVVADTTDVNYAELVAMETALESANVSGNKVFIVSPSAKGKLKTSLKATGVAAGFLMEGTEINGYNTLSTSAVPSNGVIFGSFQDYVIAQWGGIDLTIDPFSQAANGKVRLVINAFFDAKPRRNESFVKAILK